MNIAMYAPMCTCAQLIQFHYKDWVLNDENSLYKVHKFDHIV